MGSQIDGSYWPLAEVRNKKNKMLCQVCVCEQGLLLEIKLKGDETRYCIPIGILLELYDSDDIITEEVTKIENYGLEIRKIG